MLRRIVDPSELAVLSQDAGIVSLTPRLAYLAESEEDVAAALSEASDSGLAVTARGGGTGIPTQSVGGGALLIQRRSEVRLADWRAVCEPGVVKADLNQAIAGSGRWMPVDPSSYASCTVGGMVANNASGLRTLKYGSTIDYVTSLRAVSSEGEPGELSPVPLEEASSSGGRTARAASLIEENLPEIRRERRQVTKNSSGYRLERVIHDGVFDLPKLFVGSEGTLGVITEATLSLVSKPSWRMLLVVESSLEEMDAKVGLFRRERPSALELVDKSVFRKVGAWNRVSRYSRSEEPYIIFCEFDGADGDPQAKAGEISETGVAGLDPMVITDPGEVQEAWQARNESLTLGREMRSGRRTLVPGVEDLVVPPPRLGDLVRLLVGEFEKRGLEYIMYGHAGDANLHARPLLDPSDPSDRRVLEGLMLDCFEEVWKMGGSMSGEHGDGMLRAKYVEKQYPKTYWVMKEVKRLYDPSGILNPGVKVT